MDGTVRILLGGILAGLIILGVGYGGLMRSNTHVSDLVAQCGSEDARTSVSPKDPLHSARLVCDPARLRELSSGSGLVGVQAQIVEAQRNGESWFGGAIAFAIGIMLLSGIPYAWYFLLRRIRELGNAITGK